VGSAHFHHQENAMSDTNTKDAKKAEPQNLSAAPRAYKLLGTKLQLAEHKRNIHYADAPKGTTVNALTTPEFWANVASRMRPNDRIEVMPEDGLFFAELMVRSCGPNWAHVEMLRFHQFESAESLLEKSKTHKVEYNGASKWHVIRLSDRAVLTKGHDTPELAAAWLAANLKAVA
jgi:hypothetical protein